MEQDKEKKNVFLNTVGQLNRDMYYMDSKPNPQISTFAKPPIVPQSSTIHSDKSRFNSIRSTLWKSPFFFVNVDPLIRFLA